MSRRNRTQIGSTPAAAGDRQDSKPGRGNPEFALSRHAIDRSKERGVTRHVIMTALSKPPTGLIDRDTAVFSSNGYQLLVDLVTRVVITILPKDRRFSQSWRDAGCSAHRARRPYPRRFA